MDLKLKATWQELIGGLLWSVHMPNHIKLGAIIRLWREPNWIKWAPQVDNDWRDLISFDSLAPTLFVLIQCWCQLLEIRWGFYLM